MSKVGNLVSRVNSLDRTPRIVVKSVFALLVVLVLSAAVLYFTGPRLSGSERDAVKESNKAASGFKKDSDGYSFTQLNKAVEFALDNKCTEARAVYEDAADHPNGLPASDIRAYKKRIDDICSGKAQQSQNDPKRNDF